MTWFGPPPALEPVPRVDAAGTAAFFRDHWGQHPLHLSNMLTDWAAPLRWSPQHLREAAGDARVTARQYRADRDIPFFTQTIVQTQRLRLDAWCDYLDGTAPDTLPGEPHTWSLRETQEVMGRHPGLKREVPFASLFPEVGGRFDPYLWFGPGDYVTGLHVDIIDLNLLAQLWGEKDVVLFPPSDNERLYPEDSEVQGGLYSLINSYTPDLQQHPLFADARGFETHLVPGDLLYIPNGWWHATRSCGVSVSVNGACPELPDAALWAAADGQ